MNLWHNTTTQYTTTQSHTQSRNKGHPPHTQLHLVPLYHRDVCALCVFGCLGTLHTMVPLRDMLLVIELTEKESSGSQKSHVLWLGRVSAQVAPLDLLSSQPHTVWLRLTNLAPSSEGRCGWAELFSIIGRPKIQSDHHGHRRWL
jgi:hypothetical protein